MEIEVNDNNFEKEVIKSDLPCLVDFWAPWCGPCLMFAPVLKEIAEEYHSRLKVCKLNVDEYPELASRYGIVSIPTLMVFKNGEALKKAIGALSKRELESIIHPYI